MSFDIVIAIFVESLAIAGVTFMHRKLFSSGGHFTLILNEIISIILTR
jgi:hypothetical protein